MQSSFASSHIDCLSQSIACFIRLLFVTRLAQEKLLQDSSSKLLQWQATQSRIHYAVSLRSSDVGIRDRRARTSGDGSDRAASTFALIAVVNLLLGRTGSKG